MSLEERLLLMRWITRKWSVLKMELKFRHINLAADWHFEEFSLPYHVSEDRAINSVIFIPIRLRILMRWIGECISGSRERVW